MTAYVDDRHRAVVPRWRPTQVSIETGETAQPRLVRSRSAEHQSLLAEKTRAWHSNAHPLFAADVLSCALALGDAEAAREVAAALANATDAPAFTRDFARRVLSPAPVDPGTVDVFEPGFRYRRIHALRIRTRVEPRNAFTWADMAYEYACIGETAKALQAAATAGALAPENRLLLRATARLLVHTGDLETAHDLLARASNTPYDSWLMAAEVATATAAKRAPRHLRAARAMVADRSRTPHAVSELAAALASLSLHAGRLREARRLFATALRVPTENALAQATWAWRQERSLGLGIEALLSTPRSFEATAWLSFQAGRWAQSLESSQQWATDQPFSSRPFILGSYLAAHTLEDFGLSEKLASAGLQASPDDFSLLNNVAFALACQGRIADARRAFSAISFASLEEHQKVVWLATDGLLEYRAGFAENGYRQYQDAIEKARELRLTRLEIVAAARRAFEELRLGLPAGEPARREALSLRHRLAGQLDVQALLDRLEAARPGASKQDTPDCER